MAAGDGFGLHRFNRFPTSGIDPQAYRTIVSTSVTVFSIVTGDRATAIAAWRNPTITGDEICSGSHRPVSF
jgi:hypothetical protein